MKAAIEFIVKLLRYGNLRYGAPLYLDVVGDSELHLTFDKKRYILTIRQG